MTQNVDDVHGYDSGFSKAMGRLEVTATSQHNKDLIKGFVMNCKRDELAKSTTTNYLNLLTRMTERLKEVGYNQNLDELEQTDFDKLLLHLEVRGICSGEIRNYKKVIKKFYRWKGDGELPKWVSNLKLKSIESTVQPSDLLTQSEIDKILGACRHPRRLWDKIDRFPYSSWIINPLEQ
jgi:integrase/recombinase XerD